MEVSAPGASGANACHAASASLACDQGKDAKNQAAPGARWVCRVRLVTIPKLPPPPPRQAQNRSSLVSAPACRTRPSAVTIVSAADVVRGQAPAPAREPVPAPECEAPDPDRGAAAARNGEPAARKCGVHVDQLRAGPDRRPPAADPHTVHPGQVDDHSVAGRRVAAVAMAARARHDVHVEAVRPPDDGGHVLRRLGPHDRVGPGAVEAQVVDEASRVVAGAVRKQDPALHGRPQCPRGLFRERRRLGKDVRERAARQRDGECAAGRADEELATVESGHEPTLTPGSRRISPKGHDGVS